MNSFELTPKNFYIILNVNDKKTEIYWEFIIDKFICFLLSEIPIEQIQINFKNKKLEKSLYFISPYFNIIENSSDIIKNYLYHTNIIYYYVDNKFPFELINFLHENIHINYEYNKRNDENIYDYLLNLVDKNKGKSIEEIKLIIDKQNLGYYTNIFKIQKEDAEFLCLSKGNNVAIMILLIDNSIYIRTERTHEFCSKSSINLYSDIKSGLYFNLIKIKNKIYGFTKKNSLDYKIPFCNIEGNDTKLTFKKLIDSILNKFFKNNQGINNLNLKNYYSYDFILSSKGFNFDKTHSKIYFVSPFITFQGKRRLISKKNKELCNFIYSDEEEFKKLTSKKVNELLFNFQEYKKSSKNKTNYAHFDLNNGIVEIVLEDEIIKTLEEIHNFISTSTNNLHNKLQFYLSTCSYNKKQIIERFLLEISSNWSRYYFLENYLNIQKKLELYR